MRKISLKKYFKSEYLFLLLLLLGISFYFIKPAWILEGGREYTFQMEEVRNSKTSCLLDHEKYNIFSAGNKGRNLNLKYFSDISNSTAEMEILYMNIYDSRTVWHNGNGWFCGLINDTDVVLVNLFDESGDPVAQQHLIHSPEWKKNLYSDITRIGETDFHGFYVDTDMENGFRLDVKSDTLKLAISLNVLDEIKYANVLTYKTKKVFSDIADSLSCWTGENISVKDVFCIYSNARRASWFRNVKSNHNNDLEMRGRILSISDLNNNGKDEFIIEILGSRYMPTVLVCYEIETSQVLWERAIYEAIDNLKVADLNDDGFDEVVISTFAHGNEHGTTWFELENPYDRYHSSLTILDHNGDTKYLNGEEMHYIAGTFAWHVYHCILPDKRILFGSFSAYDDSTKFLKVLNPRTGNIDTLETGYHDLLRLKVIDNEIIVMHKDPYNIYKTVLDKDLNVISTKSNELAIGNLARNDCWFYHEGKRFWVSSGLKILDDDLKLQYSNPTFGGVYGLQKRGNDFYFNAVNPADRHVLVRGSISKNTILNDLYVVIWIILLITFIVYIITKTIFNLPAKVYDGSYAVLYNFFGFMYNWRIFGAGSMYKQPVIGSLRRDKFYNMIEDLADSYKQVQVKNLGLVKLHYYRLIVGNEMHIIQRIAHDVKNQMHLMSMGLENLLGDNEEMSKSLKRLYEKTELLSDFSRINLMEKKKIDIISVIDFVLIRFCNHPRYHDIIWDPPQIEFIIEGDENLLQIAFLNIFENSLRYSPEESKIPVLIEFKDKKINIKIKNDIKSGDIKGIKGSGIGTQVSEKIISAHGGEISFLFGEVAAVEIKFPMIIEEKYE